MIGRDCGVVGASSISFCWKIAEVDEPAISLDASAPLTPLSIHAFEARLGRSNLATIADIFSMRANPKVAAPVIQAISVYMVNHFTVSRGQQLPVHQNKLSLDVRGGISAMRRYVPMPDHPAHPRVVLIVNYRMMAVT
jgi:hypothetical protein